MIKIAARGKTYVSYVLHTFRGSKAADNVDILISALEDQDPDVRLGAILLLGSLGDAKAVEPLRKLLDDPDPEFRTHATNAINEIEVPEKQNKLGFSAKMDLPQKPIVGGGATSTKVWDGH